MDFFYWILDFIRAFTTTDIFIYVLGGCALCGIYTLIRKIIGW